MYSRFLSVGALCAAALLGATAHAQNVETASYAIEYEAKLVTDQRTRGISDSFNRPGARFTVQAVHESGLLGLLELAIVSKHQFTGGNGTAITAAAGYRMGDPEAWHFGMGLAKEFLPGAKFDAPHGFDFGTFTPTDFRSTKYDTAFAVFEIGYGALDARVMNVVSKNYRGISTGGVCGTMLALMADPTRGLECYARGDHGARGSWLVDLDYKLSLDAATTLTLHAGYQKIANFSEANFADYRIGIVHKRWGFDWGADWVTTRTRVRELYLAADGAGNLRATDGNKLVLSVSRRF
jgi:hypothetical protein